MQVYEEEGDQYPTIYEDENYAIWIDVDEQIVNIFFTERGLTLHFTYEDFQSLREDINDPIRPDTDERMVDIYLEESALALYFTYEDFEAFRDILNSLELMPKRRIYWH